MPRLSLCMIVRDEAELLGRALASVQGVVDEVVVVDTGSTDATLEVAAAHGARIGHFTWIDDFAAARNAALDLATGDWVLVLDADEVLEPGGGPALHAALDGPDEGYLLDVENVVGAGEPSTTVPILRLFRRDPRVRFRGCVHEQVSESLEELGWTLGRCAARLKHDGYLASRVDARDKLARNLELLQRRAAEEPTPYLLFHVGKTLLAMGQPEEALVPLERAVEGVLASPARYPFAERAVLLLATARWRAKGMAAAARGLEPALGVLGHAAEVWQFAGVLARRLDDVAGAEHAYRRALELARPGDLVDEAALGLGKLLEARGDHAEALRCYRLAVELAPSCRDAWIRIGAMALGRGEREDAIAAYEQVRRLDPRELAAVLALATLYFEAGRVGQVGELLDVAEAVKPGMPEVQLMRKLCR